MRTDAVLSTEYQKNQTEERFIEHFNSILSTYQEDEYRILPEEYSTVHVIGAPRSGTTLLTQAIASHLEVGCINNLIASFWKAPVYGIRLSQKLLGNPSPSSYTSDFGRTAALHEPHEFGYFWSSMLHYEDMHEHPSAHELTIDWCKLGTVLKNMAAAFDSPIVFKSFLLGWHVRRMIEELPKTIFVWISREPVANALSIIRARKEYRGSLNEWLSLKPRECNELDSDHYWSQAVAQIYYLEKSYQKQFEQAPCNNVLHLRYEDFCVNPHQSLQQIQELVHRNGNEISIRSNPIPSFIESIPKEVDDDLKTLVQEEVEKYWGDNGELSPQKNGKYVGAFTSSELVDPTSGNKKEPHLAVEGGPPIRTSAFPPWPVFDDMMVDSVVKVLKSGKVNYWTGNEVRLFENEFAEFVGTSHAVAVANGTVALELALQTIGSTLR